MSKNRIFREVKESIEPYSDYVIADYTGFTFADLVKVVEENKKQ